MMSKKSPQLRFEGFTDDWEERKIKDIFKITRGQVLAATETSEEKSDISPFPVYSSQTKNNGLMGYYKDYLFDTAITWTTDGANAGTVSYRSGRFYSTNVNGVLISDKGYTNKAISEILNLEAWKWVSHVGNPKLMNNVMGDISIMIPSSFEEQDRLSDFLNQLDDTIALHQRKLDLLKEQKKGYLQKMFPKNGEKVPELRFAGFADDWELHKLGELSQKISVGIATSSSKHFSSQDQGVPFIKNQDIKENRINTKNLEYISKEFDNKNKNKRVRQGDIITARTGYPGLSAVVPKELEGAQTFTTLITRPISEIILSEYISIFINSPYGMKQISGMEAGGAQKNVNAGILQNLLIPLPSLDEQKQISNFVLKLDNTITLHQRKLDLLKEQKKGFFQKMFV